MLHEAHSDFVRKICFCKRSLREKERKQAEGVWYNGTVSHARAGNGVLSLFVTRV